MKAADLRHGCRHFQVRLLEQVGDHGSTDCGLEDLTGLNQLFVLSLNGTKVTDEGVQKLQRVLPNCGIYGRPT